MPGITAAKVGAALTTLTDRATNPRLTEALRRTCQLNRVPESRVQIVPLSWGVFSPELLQLPPQDILLASDCFYESTGQGSISDPVETNDNLWWLYCTDFEDILVTVSYLMEKNKNCKFWTCYQDRRYQHIPRLYFSDVIMISLHSSNRSLWPLLQRWGLECETIPLESVQESSPWVKLEGPSPSKLNSPYTLHLWEITRHR